jgi:hypothetical protein
MKLYSIILWGTRVVPFSRSRAEREKKIRRATTNFYLPTVDKQHHQLHQELFTSVLQSFSTVKERKRHDHPAKLWPYRDSKNLLHGIQLFVGMPPASPFAQKIIYYHDTNNIIISNRACHPILKLLRTVIFFIKCKHDRYSRQPMKILPTYQPPPHRFIIFMVRKHASSSHDSKDHDTRTKACV